MDGENTNETTGTENVESTSENVTNEKSETQTLLDKYTKTENEDQSSDKKTEGETVDLIFGRYKNMEEAEKGHAELRKTLSEQGKISPDEYTLDLGEGYAVEEGDELLGSFSELAKKHNLSNEAYNELVQMKLDSDMQGVTDPTAEMALLGPKGMDMVKGIDTFLKGSVSEESYEVLRNVATTAAVVKALDELRGANKSFNPPATGSESHKAGATLEEAQSALAKAKEAEASGSQDAPMLRKIASAKFKEVYPE